MGKNYFGQRKFIQTHTPYERFEAAKKPAVKTDPQSHRDFAWSSYTFLLVSAVMSLQPHSASAAVATVKAILPM